MPFKLKLKKSRQYNVVSKSLFVISIELLDGVVVECTLGSDSLGQECLENVCQRLVINQPELFGLRYASRQRGPRWLDLDRPLKRQLDKHAASNQLWLRVMYYVTAGTATVTDEMTRYHYFLQLKNDLSEGKIACDCRQAVVLASYGRQAEYGNHDAERHTVDYLKNLLSFPKLIREGGQIVERSRLIDGQLEYLTAAVIQHHTTLYNLSQASAEEGYISTCQMLTGYGQETFIAYENSRQNEIDISVSLTGITLTQKNSDTTKFYKWSDIRNVINHKRNFSIECQNPADTASFMFNSAEEGKYVWRLCVLQHTFYTKHQQSLIESDNQNFNESQHLSSFPVFQNDGMTDSRDDLDCITLNKENSQSIPGLLENPELCNLAYGGSQQELQSEMIQALSNTQRALSTSCLDLTVSNSNLQSQTEIDKLKAFLPSYRAAPDYDTAIQQKYSDQLQPAHFSTQARSSAHLNPMNPSKPFIYGSHPEIHRPIHYPDVTRHTAVVNGPIRHPENLSYMRHDGYSNFPVDNGLMQPGMHQPVHYLNVYKPPPPYPSNGLVSNSTPDLAIASQISPAGYNRNFISSHVSGSSPDLVSSRTFLSRQYLSRLHGGNIHNIVGYPGVQNMLPSVHGTYENLASVIDVPSTHYILEAPHHLASQIQKVHDDRGNIIYCMPATQVPYRSHMVLHHQKLKTVSDSQEPIYENVPLPWQNDQTQSLIRDRAYSFTSAPDVSRVMERKISQPISVMLNQSSPAPQMNVALSGGFPMYNQNLQPNTAKYVPDNHYVNAQVLRANSGVNQLNETVTLKDKVSSKTDLQDITSSLKSLALAANDHENVVSLKGSTTGVNMIQKSDNNNVTTITISSSENQLYGAGKSQSSMKKSNTSDIIHNNSQQSEILNAGLDFSHPTSSYFETTNSTICDFDSSAVSSNTSGSAQGKDKKKRRWMMFGGRSHKTEIKSATLGRDKAKKNQNAQESTEKHRWSTALPKLQPLPPSISKEAMCLLLEKKMADTHLSFAFERIPKGRDNNTDMTTALNPENSHLNAGNIDYLPYEDNRVRLTPLKINKQGYINASHITATVGSNQRFYIACSLPNQGSSSPIIANIFWQAVWEVGARVIAFISSNSSTDYLPELLPGRVKEYGQYQVFVESSQSTEYVITSRLRLMNGKIGYGNTGTLGQMRTLWHLQYIEWPDNITIPKSMSHFLGFLEELSAVRQHCTSEITVLHNPNPPIFVACSQGAGRTGVTIAADLLLYTLEHNQELDIQRVVGLLHQQRANLMQNVHQYRFIHGLIIHYSKQTRLI